MTQTQKRSGRERTIRYDHRRIPDQTRRLNAARSSIGRLHPPSSDRPSLERPPKVQSSTPSGFPSWWTHLWSGLVRDATGKHHKILKQAIWLYLYFLIAADWRKGSLFRRIPTIATETGLNIRTIQRWLKTLRNKGYIVTRSNGRSIQIWITKWRPISRRGRGP